MSSAARSRITPEEYLARERRAEGKSEYHAGEVFAMAGASLAHNLIVHNLSRELGIGLRDRPCIVATSDLRVAVRATGLYTYPDVVVLCGEPRFLDDQRDTVLNPTLLIEVLSPSTAAYDRGAKFEQYRRLESLRQFVLVAQDRVFVERYTRQGGDWMLTELSDPANVLVLDSIGCAVPLAEVYAKVDIATNRDDG